MLDISGISGRPPARVLSGKQKGEQARSDFNVDVLDGVEDEVSVILPKDLEAITPSFVLGMFGVSVRKLGSVDEFFRKYRFSGAQPHVMAQLRRGAEYSLVRGMPIQF